MTAEEIAYIQTNKKLKRGWSDYSDYIILVFPLFFILFDILFLYSSLTDPQFSGTIPKPIVIIIESILLVPCIAFLRFTVSRLRQNISFKSVITPFTKSENMTMLTSLLIKEYNMTEQFPDYIGCLTKISITSWGEKILLFPLDYEILINSHPIHQPVTINKDVRNIKKLENLINEAVAKGKKV